MDPKNCSFMRKAPGYLLFIFILFLAIETSAHYIYRKGTTETDSWIVCTVMPKADIYYVNRELFSLYSGLAAGVSHSFCHTNYSNRFDQSFNYFSVAYQLNALGIRVGKDIAGYVEFGFGYQGMVNLGISARL